MQRWRRRNPYLSLADGAQAAVEPVHPTEIGAFERRTVATADHHGVRSVPAEVDEGPKRHLLVTQHDDRYPRTRNRRCRS